MKAYLFHDVLTVSFIQLPQPFPQLTSLAVSYFRRPHQLHLFADIFS